jgi:DNA topoisomerase IA
MLATTIHVFPSDGAWVVKSEGTSGRVFVTQAEAIQAARKSVRSEKTGQFVVHGLDGRIQDYATYGMTPVQEPPRKSRRASDIERAVSEIALRRVQSDALIDRFHQLPFRSRLQAGI